MYRPDREIQKFKDIKHKCKSCGKEWTIKMLLVRYGVLSLPTYTGSDTYCCPECKSGNTIMFSDEMQVEPIDSSDREKIARLLADIKGDDWEWASTKQDCFLQAAQILALNTLTPEVVDGMVQEAKFLGAKEERATIVRHLDKLMKYNPVKTGALRQELGHYVKALKSKEKVNEQNKD